MTDWYRRLWSAGAGEGAGLRVVSILLAPLEGGYRLAVGVRNWAHDRGLARSSAPAIPTVAVGNLTVGGTGKTPFTAWLAGRLEERGSRPAVVTRGYGEDEVAVHRTLNPGVPVIVSADRAVGIARAASEGAGVAVLDDAFQHRRLRAHGYLVLVAAEDWSERPRLLPRGPWREPLSSLGRATLAIVTRKEASRQVAEAVRRRLRERQPDIPVGQLHLRLARLYQFEQERGLEPGGVAMDGFRAPLAIAGIARPESLWRQLEAGGARVERRLSFPDHHRYGRRDVARIVDAGAGPIILTLKDAVKLRRLLPSNIDTYVPRQEIEWEAGREALESVLARVLGCGRTGVGR